MPNLALLDLIRPYVLRGENLGGQQHAALAAIRVVSFETATDDWGIAMRGRCELNGFFRINPAAGGLQSIAAGVNEADPAFDPNRRDPVFDLRETAIDFELFVPRVASAVIAQGEATIGAAGFANARTVLQALRPIGAGPDDYPASGFTLDLIVAAPSLRPPFLHPAVLNALGLLAPHPTLTEVELTLPKLRFRLQHGTPPAGPANLDQLNLSIDSLGAPSLDDPSDFGVAELIAMNPPYAFVGGSSDRTFGFGFRSAVLDLSQASTPPALLAKAGVGDDWTGLYFPEARIFISPHGARDFAVEAGANELLIGFGPGDGVWGDFEAMVVDQGSGELKLRVRFVDPAGKVWGIQLRADGTAEVFLPASTQLVVDVSGGRAPYTRQVDVGQGLTDGQVFAVELGDEPLTLAVHVHDAGPGAQQATADLLVTATRREAPQLLSVPIPPPPGALPATLQTAAKADLKLVILSQDEARVLVATEPRDPGIRWALDGGVESGPQMAIEVAVAAGAQPCTLAARKPGAPVGTADLPFYFYFDRPLPVAPPEGAPLADYAGTGNNLSTGRALSKYNWSAREAGAQDPLDAYGPQFAALDPAAAVTLRGFASYEGDDTETKRNYNYQLARRRALAVRERLALRYPLLDLQVASPTSPTPTQQEIDGWIQATDWDDPAHQEPDDRDWWLVRATLPQGQTAADRKASGTLVRPAQKPQKKDIVIPDPPPETPAPPDWFRSARLKVRVVRSQLIAAELEAEVDVNTATEKRLQDTGQLNGAAPPKARTLQNGTPLAAGNPADGITRLRLLCQADPATGHVEALISVGADPADKDGLLCFGWLPGETRPAAKDLALSILGSCLTFWPLLDAAAGAGQGAVVSAALEGAALVVAGVIGALPFVQVERVVLYGAEYVQRVQGDDWDGTLFFDVGIDWSGNLLDLIVIDPAHPLCVRYKAIGLRFGSGLDPVTKQLALHAVFDSARGYTIDVANGGAIKIKEPLGQILKILGARMSRFNPLTLEVDLGFAIDLGVVTIERAGVRLYLDADPPKAPELTAFGAGVDIPGALVGSGYVQITEAAVSGQLDLTLRPIALRIAAAVEIRDLPPQDGGPATAVYVGLFVELPVALPLANTGLGIFGFRGIFGMHYERNPAIGADANVPSLEWLKESEGQPQLLVAPSGTKLWTAKIDRWSFGLGMLVGTLDGTLMNLDGTLLLELPGPRLLVMMKARIVSPPPSADQMGASGGVLAVIEISPEHLLIGVLIDWSAKDLIKIEIPIEAVFPFGAESDGWHIYLGARKDLGQPITVKVLGLVEGTGYLMFKGDGLPAYSPPSAKEWAKLPAIQGFGIGLGAAASFRWGDDDVYLQIGGGMDAVVGFDPFLLAGVLAVAGDLHLWIVSIGADATLLARVAELPGPGGQGSELAVYVRGEACGHVDCGLFEVSGCVEIELGAPKAAALPTLVEKVSLKSRSPALLLGSGVDRGIDTSLGEAGEGEDQPPLASLPVVPIDAIPVIAMTIPPGAADGLTIAGLGVAVDAAPGVPADGFAERGGERYRYRVTGLAFERIDPATGVVLDQAVQGSGEIPALWWTRQDATEPSPNAQLALFTWEPTPASKAIEKSELLKETVHQRWGQVCRDACPGAEVLWTFRWEPLGPTAPGWDLEGIAWPDPPQTRRSGTPDTGLSVTERWRSGDWYLDQQRGIFPALVIAGAVPCAGRAGITGRAWPADPSGAAPQLVVGGRGPVASVPSGGAVSPADPLHRALVGSIEQQPVRIAPRLAQKATATLAVTAATTTANGATGPLRVVTGAGLPSAAGAPTTSAPATTATSSPTEPRPACEVRLLKSPILDDGRAVALGDPAKKAEVESRLALLGVTHGPLDEVVELNAGALAWCDLLLYVRRSDLEPGRVAVRLLDGAGKELGRVVLTWAHRVLPGVLPARWSDPAGPWAAGIAELLAWGEQEPQKGAGWLAVYVRLPGSPQADRIEIGRLPGAPTAGPLGGATTLWPAYYLAAAGALRQGELDRFAWDETQIEQERATIGAALGPMSGQSPLLFADSLYRVRVSWSGERKPKPEEAQSGLPQAPPTPVSGTQSFWFRTNRILDPGPEPLATPLFSGRDPWPDQPPPPPPLPVRLDPWMLVTLPADRETHWLWGEPVRLVFATSDLERLFTAYGKELRVRFQAASAHHPEPTPDLPHPVPVVAPFLKPLPGIVLSPWEECAVEVLGEVFDAAGKSCVPVDEERIRHSEMVIPVLLDPYTDYILDLELVPQGAPDDARGPSVYRRWFSTGAFQSLAALAAGVQACRPQGRFCKPGAMAAVLQSFLALGRQPQGAELDDRLREQGLEPLGVPQVPRILVFWSHSGAALPVPEAVLIEASEPLWRSRPYPRQVADDSGPQTLHRWVLQDAQWLGLEERPVPGQPAAVAQNGLLQAPGGQRALIVLAPEARDRTLRIALAAKAFPELPFLDSEAESFTLLDLMLARAPWEEV